MKKSNLILLFALGVLVLFFFMFQLTFHRYVKKGVEKGIGEFVSSDRSIPRFTKLKVSKNIKVLYTQDNVTQLKIEAPEKALDSIQTQVKENELTITIGQFNIGKDTVRIWVNNNRLNALEISSKAYFETLNTVSGNNLTLTMRDNSKAKLNISYDLINCEKDLSSTLELKGKTNKINFLNTE